MPFDDLDAPQFSTFDDTDQVEVETYFNVDHENTQNANLNNGVFKQGTDDEVYYSPMSNNSSNPTALSSCKKNVLELRSRKVRRSLSTGCMQLPRKNISENVDDSKKPNSGPSINNSNQFKYGQLRKTLSSSQSKLKWCSQESLNRLAAPKNISSSNGLITSSPYVSVAEAVKKFQEKTPTRFHTQNKKLSNQYISMQMKLKPTIPQSPHLLTKQRIKHNEPILSHDEREQLEFEEAQKFKIKAHPINKKILQQPLKAFQIEKKPATIPEPFNITEVIKKQTVSPKKAYHFHARPVPKSALISPKLPKKHPIKVTLPVTPPFIKKAPKPSPLKKTVDLASKESTSLPLRSTQPAPFSFEKRDKNVIKKREELIKKVEEEEKKAREFHARPIPKSVANVLHKQKSLNGSCSSSSSNQGDTRKSTENIAEEPFKARPPSVLYQKPFQPKKVDQPFTEIQPFNLQGELRAKKRENFEMKLKQKEVESLQLTKKLEEKRKQKEEEEIKMIRKEIEFKAQPIRKFKELVIKPSGKVTEPMSPIFLSGKSNKENVMRE